MTQGPDEAKATRTSTVRTEEIQTGKYPEHVVELETSLDGSSLEVTEQALDALAFPSPFASPAAQARELMGKLASAVDDLDRNTALLKLAIGHTSETEATRVKLSFVLEGQVDGFSDAEIEAGNRRADELDAEYLGRHPGTRA